MTATDVDATLEDQLTGARSRLAAATAAVRQARAARQAAQGEVNRIEALIEARRASKDHATYVDEAEQARIADAAEILAAAEAEYRRVADALRQEYTRKANRETLAMIARERAQTAELGRGRGVGAIDIIGGHMSADRRLLDAEQMVRDAKSLHRRRVREAQRGEQMRKYQATARTRAESPLTVRLGEARMTPPLPRVTPSVAARLAGAVGR